MRHKVLCDVLCFSLVYLLLSGAFCAFAIKLGARQTACKRRSFSTKCTFLLALMLLCFSCFFFCVSHPVVCMYGTVGVVFVSFLLRSSFQYFLVAVNYNVVFNPECKFKNGFSRCSECFQPRFFRRMCEQCILQVKFSAPGALFFLGTTIPRSSRPQS